ncbi:hypothetical protein BU25DRAFT_410846 [Macroventuria anomochaeta]|uniref:Uncharacterized protein n=1 Tax=Macroventuria anomochaeta TaxID=301207 RepID=A0ACB6S100_9PLEO|nr:uncharacterized protein BU25DRAFT_410846 [Macroventuria anomochaeta]KAF2627708.1 hypothetical protein BU25DRAFT_410846 [Macroventuria anomochaeta]
MSDTTVEQWIYNLTRQYSFPIRPWDFDPSDPYAKAIDTFQSFTSRIVAALRHDDVRSWSLVQDGKLNKIYDDLPCFNTCTEYMKFRGWVKDATFKHPQRRTPKQHQWLCIVDLQESEPTYDIEATVIQAADYLSTWKKRAYAIENLMIDWPTQYFFRSKHAIKDAEEDGTDFGDSCWICANDFDADLHLPQRGPCGHYQCRRCFQKALEHAAAEYTCAFCRACLICGTNSCKNHIIPREEAPPHPLNDLLRWEHFVCPVGRCTAIEPLCGFSPKRYWSLREQSRKNRVRLTKIYWYLKQDLTPEHRAHVGEELDHLYNGILKAQVEQAWALQMEDEETERRATLREAVPLLETS